MQPLLKLPHKPLFWCALAVAVVAGVAFAVWPKEPRYEGKPLSYWLEHLPVTGVSSHEHSVLVRSDGPGISASRFAPPVSTGGGVVPTTAEAGRAVVEIGSRGLPILLQRLRTRERHRTTLEETFHEWSARLHLVKPALPPWLEAYIKRGRAVSALILLGETTKPVLPQIVVLAKSDPDPNVRASATEVLRNLSPSDYTEITGLTNFWRGVDLR